MDDNMELWSVDQLVEHEFEQETFLVDPVMPLGGLVLVHGKRGVGKTQFMLNLSNAIVNGYKWLGRWDTTRGKVLFIQTDMTPQLQQLRVQKVADMLVMDGLWFMFPQGMDIVQMERRWPRQVEQIRALDPVLIIWDTLRKIHSCDEDKSWAPGMVYSSAKRCFPRATHVFVHHDKKSPSDPQFEVEPEEQFRGSGDWIDSADTSIQLRTAATRKSPKRIVMLLHKARTMPDIEKKAVVLEMDLESMLLLPVGPDADTAEARLYAPDGQVIRGLASRADAAWNKERARVYESDNRP